MRKLIALLIIALSGTAFAGTCGNGYTYSRKFNVNFALVPNTDQTNFPVPFSFNGAGQFGSILLLDLRTVANGGQIQNTAANSAGITGPADFIVCDAASAGNAYKFEIAQYDASTGLLEGYLKYPTLSHTANSPFWIFYGNASVSTSQQDLSMWSDASFVSVYHLGSLAVDSAGGLTFTNTSTTNSTTNTVNGSSAVFNGSAKLVASGSTGMGVSTLTMEFWLNPTSIGAGNANTYASNFTSGASQGGLWMRNNNSQLDFIGFTGSGNLYVDRSSGNILTAGIWNHYAETVTGSTRFMYLNGVSTAYSNIAGPVATLNTTVNALSLGEISSGTFPYNGAEDEVRFSSTNRSADWMATTYNSLVSPSAFSTMTDSSTSGVRIVQYISCNGTSVFTCTLPNSVTSGNMLITVSNTGDHACSSGDYSDTLTSTFSLQVGTPNVSFGDSNSCILSAPLSSSGADTITFSAAPYPGGMVVYEIAGMSGPSQDVTSNISASTQTITTPSVTATTSNSLLICGSSTRGNGRTPVQTFSPSGATAFTINNFNVSNGVGGSAIIQFTGSGSKSCAFTFGAANTHETAVSAVLKYTPVVPASKRRIAQVY